MSTRKNPKPPKRPEWLKEYRKRTELIEVIDMAFNPDYTDKQVRQALKKTAKQLGEMFTSRSPMSDIQVD